MVGKPWDMVMAAQQAAAELPAEEPQARALQNVEWLDVTEKLLGHEEEPWGQIRKEEEASWHHTGIVTFTAPNDTQAVDAAVMLGLSLQRHVPEFFRICLVLDMTSQSEKLLLANAGWVLVEVPADDSLARTHGDINIFRVRFRRLVYFSPYFLLRNNDLYGLLEKYWLPLGKIGMVRRSGSEEGWEGGMMVFRPDKNNYTHLREFIIAHPRSTLQQAVSEQFGDGIVELQSRWNVHGRADPEVCDRAVLSHFTGTQLPTVANVETLRQLKLGNVHDGSTLNCTNLVFEYFRELKQNAPFLSPQLREALAEMDSELQFGGTGSAPPQSLRSPHLWSLMRPLPLQRSGAGDSRLALATKAHLACLVLACVVLRLRQ